MKEACGVVGIVAPGRSVSHLCYDALYALQHRGQESAGMATFQQSADHGGEGQRTGESRLRRDHAARAGRHHRHRPHALLDLGFSQLDSGSAGLPLGRVVGLRTSRTTATSPTRPRWPKRRASSSPRCCRTRTSSPSCSRARSSRAAHSAKALGVVLGAHRRRVLHGGLGGRTRCTRCATPTAFARSASGASGTEDAPEGWIVASESPALDVVGATFVREIATGRDGDHHRPRRDLGAVARAGRGQTEALHLRVRLLRATRHLPHGPPGAHDPTPHGRAARRAVVGRRRHRHGRARTPEFRPPKGSPRPRAFPSATGS